MTMPALATPVSFLYDDAALVVVDKPAGAVVVPAPDATLEPCLRDRVASALGTRVWVVHRLDRDTSGAVVFARTAEAHRALSMAFEARRVVKRYSAVVEGVPHPLSGRIEIPLHEARRGKARPAEPDEPGAREASTGYAVTLVWTSGGRAVARVTAEPTTGRHHQIRVHLRAIGTPILGDGVYGRVTGQEPRVPRLALHASAVDVPHPTGGHRVVVEAPLPADLAALDAWLDTHWTRRTLA
jgi:tRNA pseudouridine32 synthase / 23S rRNA pseudouridine746 synthase